MDSPQWFKFNPSKWVMGRIMKCPEITQARFMKLCCLYWSKECRLSIEDAIIELDQEHYDILIAKKVITEFELDIWIDFLSEQYNEIMNVSIVQSEKGIIGNLKRWSIDFYKQYESGKISLKEAVRLAEEAKKSQSDRTPIAPRSQNVADKIREDKIDKIEDRKSEFYKLLTPYTQTYTKQMLRDFFEYWTEHGEKDRKMRFEKETSFSVERRLKTWKSNQSKFGETEKPKVTWG